MSSGNDRPIFIGCATDRKFVNPTAAMLSSIDDNGHVPEAVVIVADFGLTDQDRAVLRDSAGRLGPAMRFLPLDRSSPKISGLPAFSFPLPLLGRLIMPGEIDTPSARLLLIDSDIVVNGSLRPLFAMDMLGKPLAAAQDPLMEIEYYHHRKPGPVYFNAGLMLLDLDEFNRRDIGDASLRQLASYKQLPIYLDQCAMNDVLKGDWAELDRRWNFFQTGHDRHFEREDYEAAHIIHFAGYKPWDVDWHPATPIWNHHATRAQQKTSAWRSRVNGRPVDRHFVAMQYQVLLGRELESLAVADEREALSRTAATGAVIGSSEFRDGVLEPLRQGRAPVRQVGADAPSMAERAWAADELPVLPVTAERLAGAETWRVFLQALVADGRLMGTAGLEALPARVEPATAKDAAAPSRPLLHRFGMRRGAAQSMIGGRD